MAGLIKSYQKCPRCGQGFGSSRGGSDRLECAECYTQPTKFYITLKWQGKKWDLYHDKDGRTFHHFEHVSSVLGEMRASIKRHKAGKGTFDPTAYQKQSKTSFRVFWKKFLGKYREKPGTHDKLSAIGRHHLSYYDDLNMRDIVAWHIDDWWEEMKDKDLSPKYINDCLQWLKRFFHEAERLNVIDKAPIFPVPMDKPEPDVVDWLSEEEQVLILDKLPKYDQAIFDFMFLTGVRVNEGVGLQRKDTQWDRSVTIIRHTVKRDGSLGIVKNKKKRIIPHFPELTECLKKAQKVAGFHDYQFVNRWGRRYSDDYLRDVFHGACRAVIGREIQLKNAIRHSFGMTLLRKGYDIWQVSKAMNHSDIRMTEHYAKMLSKEVEGMYGRKKGRFTPLSPPKFGPFQSEK